MQVTPLRWQPGSATAAPAMALVAERSSAGNNNKPGSPSAPCAQPVLTQDTGAQRKGGGCWKEKMWHTRQRPESGLSPPCSPLSFLMALSYPLGGRWPVTKGRRRRAGSSLLPESEGSAQLWTAGLLSVCLSPSKSTPTPPRIFFSPSASSLPPFRFLSPSLV